MKIKIIQNILNELFPNPSIPLIHRDPFTLLLAVLLSARCTDAKVNQVTPKLFELADTPQKMALQKVEDIRTIVRPCGLSDRKAHAIVVLSQILIEKYQGMVPGNFEVLESLPGVGHKTASVVMAQAFQVPAFPVDTHILRLAKRWGLSKAKGPDAVEKDLKKTFPKKMWIKLHLQMIYYGRIYCPARGHVIDRCPICSWIQEYEEMC